MHKSSIDIQGNKKLAFTSRTFKCLKCKNYTINVINEKGGTSKVCNAKINNQRIIVDLDAHDCNDYVALNLI